MGIIRKIKKHFNRLLMFFDQTSKYTYSQEGEDQILLRYFGDKQQGFYIDIGAHHPTLYSNTYLFYKKGWSGVNIDAMPGAMNLFRKKRPLDINIEAAISSKKEELIFYIFNDTALNTFSKELALSRVNISDNYKIVAEKKIETQSLSEILDNLQIGNKHINFMSIDIEGYDLQALESLNFNKYRPELILIEIYSDNLNESLIHQYLLSKNYIFFAKSILTCIYKDNNK